MTKGDDSDIKINHRTASIIHIAGFLVPIILVLYGLVLKLNISSNFREIDIWALALIAVGWIGLGVFQLLVEARSQTELAMRLTIYHLFTVAYVLLISGFAMPFIVIWAILFLATYEFFGRDGLRLSVVALFVTAIADIFANLGSDQYLLTNLMYLVATLLVGIVTVSISQAQSVDRTELDEAKIEGISQRDRVITLVNNISDAVITTDSEGIIEIYNAASLGLLDTNTELVGTSIDDVLKLHDQSNRSYKLSREMKLSKGLVTREDLSSTISGEDVRLSVIFSPIRNADSSSEHHAEGYILMVRDITKQKSLEEERDEFISVISHELRTPITVAEGTLSNVQVMMSRQDIPKSTLSDNVKMAHEQVMYLAKMVNDLSTLSRAERGIADTPEVIDIRQLINEVYGEYASQAEKKGLRFNLDLTPTLGTVTLSRLYLKELLQNFVTNAIKYTKEGEVTIIANREGKNLRIDVKDTGIGVSKSDQKRIFEKFFRSEDYRTRETGGTGLGLYVANKLAKKLGAKIEMTSRLNHGSTFSFTIKDR